MSTLKADTIQSTGGGAVTLTKQSAAKAHGFYDQNTANVFRGSFNFSSMTDNSTGVATLSFTSSMTIGDGTTYAISCATSRSAMLGASQGTSDTYSTVFLSSSIKLENRSDSGSVGDRTTNCVAVHGDLA